MGLTVKIAPDQWQGIVTKRMYYAPRECEESAEALEQDALKKMPTLPPKKCKPGSKEEAEYNAQEEALTNIERGQVKDTAVAYRTFSALHPECLQTDENAYALSEYFQLKGVPFVQFNGARVPLATSVEMWNEAYQWKTAMGAMQVDPKVMDAQAQLKAQEEASEFLKRSTPTEEELDVRAGKEIVRRSGAW